MNAPGMSGGEFYDGGASSCTSGSAKSFTSGSAKGSSTGGSWRPWSARRQPDFHEGPKLDELSLEEIEGLTAAHEAGISDAQKRMLKQAIETRELGANTLGQLHDQKQQLRRIAGDQHKLGGNIHKSNQLMKGMGWRGWLGWLPDRVTGLRPPNQGDLVRETRAENGGGNGRHGSCDAPSSNGNGALRAATGPSPWGKKKEAAQEEQVMERGVDAEGMVQISSVLDELRLQAQQMNSELKEQSGMIDDAIEHSDAHQSSIKRSNRRARDIAGTSAGRRVDDTFTAPRGSVLGLGSTSARTAAKIGYNSMVARANLQH